MEMFPHIRKGKDDKLAINGYSCGIESMTLHLK